MAEGLYFSEVFMGNTIRFRRPETPYSVSRMFVSNDEDTETHVRHLKVLGYTILDVLPSPAGNDMPSKNQGEPDAAQ
jgi:hypothetical protein